jgi:hypothetical protein
VEAERKTQRYCSRIDRNQPVLAAAKQQCISTEIRFEPLAEPPKILQHAIERVTRRDTPTFPQPDHLV